MRRVPRRSSTRQAKPPTARHGRRRHGARPCGRRRPQVRAHAGAGGSLGRQTGGRAPHTGPGGPDKSGCRGGTPTCVNHGPATLSHVWCAAGDGHGPPQRPRHMRARAGGPGWTVTRAFALGRHSTVSWPKITGCAAPCSGACPQRVSPGNPPQWALRSEGHPHACAVPRSATHVILVGQHVPALEVRRSRASHALSGAESPPWRKAIRV
jgi:hypothetical protein